VLTDLWHAYQWLRRCGHGRIQSLIRAWRIVF